MKGFFRVALGAGLTAVIAFPPSSLTPLVQPRLSYPIYSPRPSLYRPYYAPASYTPYYYPQVSQGQGQNILPMMLPPMLSPMLGANDFDDDPRPHYGPRSSYGNRTGNFYDRG